MSGFPVRTTAGTATANPNLILSGAGMGLKYDGSNESATWEKIVDKVISLQAAGFTQVQVNLEGTVVLGTDLGVIDGFAHALSTYTGNMRIYAATMNAGFKAANGVVTVAQTRVMVNRKCGNSAGAGAATGDKHVQFDGITWDGNAANQTVNTHGLCSRFMVDVRASNCTFKNTYGTDTSTNETFAVDFLQSFQGSWINCYGFSDDGGAMSSIFSANSSTDVGWLGCEAHDTPHGQGMTSAFCTNVLYEGNQCWNNAANGINIEHHTEGSWAIIGNNCGMKTLSGYNANNPIPAATVYPNQHGISVLSCQHGTISDNVCEYNTLNGININWDGSINPFDITGKGNITRANTQDGVYMGHCYEVDMGSRSEGNGRYGWYNDTPSTSGDIVMSGSAISNTSFGVNQVGSSNAPYSDISRLMISANNGGSGNNQAQMGIGGTAQTFQPVGVLQTRVPAVPTLVTTPAANPYPFDCLVVITPANTTAGLTVQVADVLNGTYNTVCTLNGLAGTNGPISVVVPRRGNIQWGAGTVGPPTWTWSRLVRG